MTLKIPPTITQRAYNRIAEISKNDFLRVSVQGGGCSGFKYEIILDDKISDTDTVSIDTRSPYYALCYIMKT